jgi:hypothetical protein
MSDSVMVSTETVGAMTSLKYGVEKTESPMMNNCRMQVILGDRQVLSSWREGTTHALDFLHSKLKVF